jgi:glycosyltransferase involved in cell wall biosynthesis
MKYQSPYVWPDPKIPFRHYYKSDKLNIYIIENIMHNYNWLNEYKNKIKDTDFFFVYCGWFHDDWFAKVYNEIFENLKLNKNNFFFLFNSPLEQAILNKYNFIGEVINHNCWLDENFFSAHSVEKQYDAILIARKSKFKRHYLANKVRNLALIVSGSNHYHDVDYKMPESIFCPSEPVPYQNIPQLINQAKSGLILSHKEGACFSSSEYLLCGIPVVSTQSYGGRDVWYNEYNSIICEDNPEQIASAVEYFVNNPKDPNKIRQDHIDLSKKHRQKFIDILDILFDRYEVSLDAEKYFVDNFFHKMRDIENPNFNLLFK